MSRRISPKVFGVGFHKTATTSLARALSHLGYSVTGPNEVHNPAIAETAWDVARQLVPEYDAFQDNPWPILFRELDAACPGSRFVLTIRPTEAWIRSVVAHFGGIDTPMRRWIYGVGDPRGNEALFIARYERHNREVLEYFADRPDDLLTLRITEGEGWERLCPFVGAPIPALPFPRENTAASRHRRHAAPRS